MADLFLPLVAVPEGDAASSGEAHWWVVRAGDVLMAESGELPFGPLPYLDGTETPIILGTFGPRLAWAVGVAKETEAPGGTRFVPLRELRSEMDEARWALAGRAVQLVEWARTSRFCGRCGTPTVSSPGERGLRCPSCGLIAYPRLAPAVITLVERDGEVLLANGRNFGAPMYSCVAGFVEPGETLEETVHREVGEEVGVKLGQVRYFGSQPWPFPHSLMLGFLAEWESGDIVIDPVEIADAGWFSADAMPLIPPRMSIARLLIDDWLRRQGQDISEAS
jgi:NAD+ diphosphatase